MSKLNDQLNKQSESQGERNVVTGMTDEVAYRYDKNFLYMVDDPVGDAAREIRRQSKLYESRQYVTKPEWWSAELNMVVGADISVEPGGIFDMSEAD